MGIGWWLVNSSQKGPVTWKMLPFDDVIVFLVVCRFMWFINSYSTRLIPWHWGCHTIIGVRLMGRKHNKLQEHAKHILGCVVKSLSNCKAASFKLKLKLKLKNSLLLPIYSFGHTYIHFFFVQCHTYIIHTCQVTSNISGSPIKSQWSLLKYPWQLDRYYHRRIQGYQRVITLHT